MRPRNGRQNARLLFILAFEDIGEVVDIAGVFAESGRFVEIQCEVIFVHGCEISQMCGCRISGSEGQHPLVTLA